MKNSFPRIERKTKKIFTVWKIFPKHTQTQTACHQTINLFNLIISMFCFLDGAYWESGINKSGKGKTFFLFLACFCCCHLLTLLQLSFVVAVNWQYYINILPPLSFTSFRLQFCHPCVISLYRFVCDGVVGDGKWRKINYQSW